MREHQKCLDNLKRNMKLPMKCNEELSKVKNDIKNDVNKIKEDILEEAPFSLQSISFWIDLDTKSFIPRTNNA